VRDIASRFLRSAHFKFSVIVKARALRGTLTHIAAPVIVAMGTPVNLITLRASRGLARKVITSERADFKQGIPMTAGHRVLRRWYGRADLVTANTRAALTCMADFVPPAKLAFVPNPLPRRKTDDNQCEDPYDTRLLQHPPVVLTVGRLVPEKAHDVLLQAFALTGDEMKDWRLMIVGDGPLKEELQALAASLGIDHRIDWQDAVHDPEPFYHRANVFTLPSRFEGMPNALLEAMSHGLPVIVSDGSRGPLEIVRNGATGLVFPVNDASALAIALRRLPHDPALRRRLGRAARAGISDYSLEDALAAWETVTGLPPLRHGHRGGHRPEPSQTARQVSMCS